MTRIRDGRSAEKRIDHVITQSLFWNDARDILLILRDDGRIIGVNGGIQYVNPAFERITGYHRDEVLGKNPRILKSGRQAPSFYKELWETLKRGDVWSGVFQNLRKDGTLYEEEAVISPVRDESGEVINYVAVKRDVTNERRVEEQLRQAQKMEAVGRLAGGIAHDFNNLLAAITGYSDLLLLHLPEGEAAHREVIEIRKASDRHKGPIHLLITDVVMPGMTGPELARRLTARRPAMKVLFMSGYTDDAILHHGVLEPGTEFLRKPFTAGSLGGKVRHMLDASRNGKA